MKTETDEIIKLAAEQATLWQKTIRDAQPFREFVEQGKLDFLKENVFGPMEKDILAMIRKLDFVPSSLAQLGHIKGQLETLDSIEGRIMGRIKEARDAAQKLNDLADSTPVNGNE
jgi:hypothetical protein